MDVRLLARARGGTRALIDLDAIALTADAIGLAARWTPATGLGFEVLAPNLSVLIEDRAPIPVALPVIGSDGSVALDAAGWDALEALAGLLASAAPIPWIGELAEVLGWSQTRAATPRLRLADLATDAPAAVRQWLLAIAVEEGGRLADGLAVLARVLTGTRGAFGKFDGTGRPNDPWRVPLFPRGPSPELAAWLVPDGPDLPVTNAPSVIRRWRPGDPGLQPPILARSLQSEAVAAPDVAALVSGRDNLADGLAQLAARWTGTDGRLVPPTTDPPGVTVQRVENLPSHALLNSVRLTEVLGEGTIDLVRIAVVERDKDVPWPNVPAGRLVDVRQPGLGPDAFVAPSPAPGEWFIALAPRSDARLANGDPDGVLGQAARLRTVLAPFGTLTDPVVLAAHDTAGHAVLIAADDLPFVQTVVTAGTAFTPVAFTILDEQPGADALRLLQCLLPPSDPEEPDDGALAVGRALMDALTPLLSTDDPAREIRLPAAGIPTPRSGLAVTALFAVMDEDAVFAGMTAIVAAGLAARARARDDADRRPVTGVRVGLRLPVAAAVTGVTVSGHGVIELGGADLVEGAGVASSARGLTAHLELRRAGGWLAGGPDPARGPGPRPDQEIRWLEADVQLPFGEGDGRAVIVLHDARVFAIAREQWIVGVQSSGNDPSAATPNLPEVRVLLSLVAAEIDAARTTSPAVDAAFTLLRALNVIGPQGGSVPDAIDHLLNDPAPHVREALQSDERRGQLSSALTQLLSGLPSLSFDLADGRFALDASSTPGDRGLSAWSAHVEGRSSGALQCHVEIGSSGSTAAGGALIRLDTGPLRVDLDWTRPGSPQPERIALWPSPDGAPAARAIAQVIAAECARASLEYLRSLDPSARTGARRGLRCDRAPRRRRSKRRARSSAAGWPDRRSVRMASPRHGARRSGRVQRGARRGISRCCQAGRRLHWRPRRVDPRNGRQRSSRLARRTAATHAASRYIEPGADRHSRRTPRRRRCLLVCVPGLGRSTSPDRSFDWHRGRGHRQACDSCRGRRRPARISSARVGRGPAPLSGSAWSRRAARCRDRAGASIRARSPRGADRRRSRRPRRRCRTCCWRRAEPAHRRAGSVRSATFAGMGRRSRRIPGSGIAHADERGADDDRVCCTTAPAVRRDSNGRRGRVARARRPGHARMAAVAVCRHAWRGLHRRAGRRDDRRRRRTGRIRTPNPHRGRRPRSSRRGRRHSPAVRASRRGRVAGRRTPNRDRAQRRCRDRARNRWTLAPRWLGPDPRRHRRDSRRASSRPAWRARWSKL